MRLIEQNIEQSIVRLNDSIKTRIRDFKDDGYTKYHRQTTERVAFFLLSGLNAVVNFEDRGARRSAATTAKAVKMVQKYLKEKHPNFYLYTEVRIGSGAYGRPSHPKYYNEAGSWYLVKASD